MTTNKRYVQLLALAQTGKKLESWATEEDKKIYQEMIEADKTMRRTAKELGISRAQYDTVTSGKIPTMDAPETMLRLRQDSKFSKIIKDYLNTFVKPQHEQHFKEPELKKFFDEKLKNEKLFQINNNEFLKLCNLLSPLFNKVYMKEYK